MRFCLIQCNNNRTMISKIHKKKLEEVNYKKKMKEVREDKEIVNY